MLVLEFNKYGILAKKDFYNKENMKELNLQKLLLKTKYVKKILYAAFCPVLDKKCNLEENKVKVNVQ